VDQAQQLLTLWRINARAAQRYRPSGYTGRITLFVAERKEGVNPEAVADQAAAWREVSPCEPNIIHIDASHQSLLLEEGPVGELVGHMQGLLDRFRRESGRDH
jgi:thioesterase domain-containing protein